MSKHVNPFTSLFARAWLRDGKVMYRGDALLIALLAHTTGAGRGSKDELKIHELLGDINLEKSHK